MDIKLIDLKEEDLGQVKEIYDYYILNSTATYHLEPLSETELKRFIPINHPRFVSFMIECDQKVCGYCYLGPYKPRQAYDRTAEVTVYLNPEATNRGIGWKVMEELEKRAVKNGFRVLLGIISADNLGSVRLMEKLGYTQCAYFKQVGEKFGRILDVVGYQKIL